MLNLNNLNNLNRLSKNSGSAWYKSGALLLNGILPTRIDDFLKNRYYTSTAGVSAFPFGTSVRTTNAMMFDTQGRLSWAPANELLYSNSFLQAAYWNSVLTQAPVLNPGGAPADPIGGANTWQLTAAASVGGYTGIFRSTNAHTFLTNTTYVASCYMRANTATFGALRITDGTVAAADSYCYYNLSTGTATAITPTSGTIVNVGMTNVGNGWWRCWITYTTSGTISSNLFDIAIPSNSTGATNGTYAGTESIFIFGAQLERYDVSSPKAYIPTSATGVYAPRFDTNPSTLAPAGLLVESQATSQIVNSTDLSAGTWLLTNATTVSGQSSPMGLSNAFKLAETNATGTHDRNAPLLTLAASGSFTVSIFVKAAERNFVTLQVNDTTSTNAAWCAFNLTTGAVSQTPTMLVGTFTNMAAWSQNCGNGWFRCFFTGTIGAVANIFFYTGISTTGTDRSYTGTTGSGIIQFGPMMVNYRSSGHSYIPTVNASTVTRSQDILSSQGVSWLNATQGTIYTEFSVLQDADSSFPEISSINDGTANNRVFAFNAYSTTNSFPLNRVVTAGVTQADLQVDAGAFKSISKMAYSWIVNNVRAVANGGAVGSDVSVTVPTGLTSYSVANFSGTSSAMHVRQVRYYPSASASNAQLQTLTT